MLEVAGWGKTGTGTGITGLKPGRWPIYTREQLAMFTMNTNDTDTHFINIISVSRLIV